MYYRLSRQVDTTSIWKGTDQTLLSRSLESRQLSWGCVSKGTSHCISIIKIFVDSPGHKMPITPKSSSLSDLRLPRSRTRERQRLLASALITVSDTPCRSSLPRESYSSQHMVTLRSCAPHFSTLSMLQTINRELTQEWKEHWNGSCKNLSTTNGLRTQIRDFSG